MAAVRLAGPIARMADVGGVIWVADWQNATITGVDIETLCPFVVIQGKAVAMTSVADELWVADFTKSEIVRLDGESGKELGRIGGIRASGGLGYDGKLVWAVCCGLDSSGDDQVQLLDPGLLEPVRELVVERGSGVDFGFDSAWVGRLVPSGVLKVSSDGREIVAEVDLPGGVIRNIQVTDSAVLVADGGRDLILIVDPLELSLVDAVSVGSDIDQPFDISVRGGSDAWVVGPGAPYVLRLVGGDLQPVVALLGEAANTVLASQRYVWVGTEGGLLLRIDPTKRDG
ncbi:MAG: hypothetical protein ACE5F5_12410 [Acidimicrobiia bacterium]